ncbi:MAG: cytochrome P450 [Candidatus Hydrogenedens sp.]|nr:cytochrome P450 [Candidatus Hydrogenedens sp.]
MAGMGKRAWSMLADKVSWKSRVERPLAAKSIVSGGRLMSSNSAALTGKPQTLRTNWRGRWAMLQFPFSRIAPIERWMRQEGDIATAPAFGLKFYFLNNPEMIEECLVSRHRDFHKDPFYGFLALILGNGLLTSEEDFHLRQRRMIQPAFHKQRVHGYGEAMVHYAEEMGARWRDGQQVDMNEEMMALALSIVGKTLFNSDVTDKTEEVAHALETILPMVSWYEAPFGPQLMKLPLPPMKRFRKAIAGLDTLLYGMIAEHKASGDQGDLLSMLLAAKDEDDQSVMSDKQVRDEAVTLFLAGHETTAIALTWTWYCLSQHPEVEARLVAELNDVLGDRPPTPDDYPRLQYTRQVFAETMRIFPPAYMIGRSAIRDTQIGGYEIPKDAVVVLSPYITQRSERFWPDPERFDPDRFAPGESEKRHKFTYFPFGGGRRLCIGEPFAWMEGVLVLATLARHWTAQVDPGHKIAYNPHVTLRPVGGMPMTLKRRA